jgi:hypothetical protein
VTSTVSAPARDGAGAAQDGLDARTYEVLRQRLADQSKELARRAEGLNTRRLEVFGGTELRLVGSERIRTENNCVPRDIVSIPDGDGSASGLMLFGYNVFIGLKPETTVDDVFSLHRFTRDGEAFRFEDAPNERPELLRDERFRREFTELYLSAPTAHCPIWTTRVSGTTCFRPRTTSSGPRRRGTTTCSAGSRTSPSRTSCSSRR